MSAQDQITAVADSAQDASGMVSGFLYGAVGIMEKSVVVGGAFGAGGIDTVSDFYGFNSADGKRAFPRQASSLSKTGVPSPAGSPLTRHSMTPPEESCAAMHSLR